MLTLASERSRWEALARFACAFCATSSGTVAPTLRTRAFLIAHAVAVAAIAASVLASNAGAAVAGAASASSPRPLALDWNGLRPSSEEARSARDALILEPSDRSVYRAGGTWHQMFDPSGLTNRFPVVFWVAALVALGLIGLPYLWVAAAALPDRGFALARPVALLLVGWVAWLLASLEAVTFSRTTIVVAAGVLAAGAAAISVARRSELASWLRGRWRLLAVEEAIFWTIFAAVLSVRWLNPDLWHPYLGGEKPMDFAFLNAVVKSAEFPPYDPWFAGGYINYYYFGFVLVAVLVKATAIVPYVAYNLAIPTLAAFLAAAAAGVAAALVSRRPGRVPRQALVASALAALFVVVVGNLGEIEVLIDRAHGAIPIEWWYWNATRTISAAPGEPGPVTEFPWFTYLYADLHAHAIALPYTAVALALALAYVRRTPGRGRAAGIVHFVLLALVLGALWPMNTWDFPTYALLALVALALGYSAGWRRRQAGSLLRAGAMGAALVAVSYLFFLPFHEHYRSAFTGYDRWRGSRTGIVDYLTVHGFFLFLIASALVIELWLARDLGPVPRVARLLLRKRRPLRLWRLHRALVTISPGYVLELAGVALACMLALALAAIGQEVSALVVALLTLASVLFVRRPREPASGAGSLDRRLWQMTLVLLVVGLVITLAVEYVVVKDIDIGRSATVFKYYNQVWLLWSVAAAVSAVSVYGNLRRLSRVWRAAWGSAFALLFAAVLLYPILATNAKVDDRFDRSVGPTLNGMAFMKKAVLLDHNRELRLAYDLGGIRWMLARIQGSPVVAEVNTAPTLYGWGNRYAMFTGNPAVVGWDFHERQQRGIASPFAVEARIGDVQRAYGTRDPEVAYRLLHKYGTKYIVVGPLERAYFPRGQRKWASRAGSLWDVAYHNAGVTIYRMRDGIVASDAVSTRARPHLPDTSVKRARG